VNLLGIGQLWPTDVEYYYDYYENITSQEELYLNVNNSNNISIGGNCIQFVLNDENNEFSQNFMNVFNQVEAYLSGLLCCPGSSPVTFVVQPGAVGLGAATPLYLGNQVDTQGGCNAISQNPFLTGLLGEPQDAIATIQLNTDDIWSFGAGDFDLFTVMLHEVMHGMGLFSSLLPDGSPLNGGYSPWDLHLEINGELLLERVPASEGADCCYSYKVNNDFTLPDDIITASQNGQITVSGLPVCADYAATLTPNQATANPSIFYGMLSHLDEDCDINTSTEYVLNSSLASGEIRDEISQDELNLLQTLGFCTTDAGVPSSSCYVSLVDDSATVLEGDANGVFVDILGNDALPTEFDPSDITFDLNCGDASGIIVNVSNGGFQIQGNSPGNYCFCYSVGECDDFCDNAEVCIFVRPENLFNQCEPEECTLICFGDFEDFIPEFNVNFFGQNDYLSQLYQNDFVFQEGGGNSADIRSTDGNNFLLLFAGFNQNSHIEGITIMLNEPVASGCSINIDFDADCFGNSELIIVGSEFPICESPSLPTNTTDQSFEMCGSENPFHNLFFDNSTLECKDLTLGDEESNDFNVEANLNLETVNQSDRPINFITIFLNQPEEGIAVFQIDNLSILSSCNTPLIEVVDISSIGDLTACAGETIVINYELCFTSEGDETSDVTLSENLDNALLGSVSVNPFSPFANGPVIFEDLAAGECQTVSLILDLSPNLLLGQQVEVIMEFESENACDQQDGMVSTIINITGVTPTSDFNAMIECMNDPPAVTFTSFANKNDGSTFNWNFGDGNTRIEDNPTHIYAQPGTYTVTLTVANDCGTSTTSEDITIDCDGNPLQDCMCSSEDGIVIDDPNIDTYSLLGLINDGILTPDFFDGCLSLNGTLIVDTEYTLSGATFYMQSESAIEIQPNIEFSVIDNSVIMGCDALWDGILVNNNASLQFLDSHIHDAYQAIHLMDGSSLSMQNSILNKNYIGIFVPSNALGNMNQISFPQPILNNTFECDGNLLPDEGGTYNLLFDDISYTGVLANDVRITFGITGLEVSNTFRNMYNGIRAFNSTVGTSKNLFTNIVSNDNDVETGHGLYTVKSIIFAFINSFINTEYGIRGNQSQLKSFQDEFDNVKVGIEMAAAPSEGFISILDGDFSIYSERAIVVYNSPETNIECLSNFIKNDLIYDYTLQEAISIFDSGSKDESYIVIEDNSMILGENQAGISLANSLRANVTSNGVIFVDDPAFQSSWSRGFKMSNCPFTELEGNTVSGSTLPSSGFETEDSPNQTFCCNSSSDAQIGISFIGNCQASELNANKMTRISDSGLLLSEAIIDGQTDKGNLWCDDGAVATFISDDPFLFFSSLFIVNPNDVPPGSNNNNDNCLTLPNPNISDWFDTSAKATPICGEDCLSERPEGRQIEYSDIVAANNQFDTKFSEIFNWTAGRYLLDKIDNNQDLIGTHSEVDLFYNDNIGSPMRSYNDVRGGIQNLHELTTSHREDITQFSTDINLLILSISNLDFEIFQSSSNSQMEQLIIEKNQKELELLDKSNLLRDLREQIVADRISSAQALRSVNNGLPNTNIAALNEKRINRVTLNMIINPNYLNDVRIKNLVANIANQCPASGGLAVYRARTIHDYIHPGNQNDYSDIDDCYENTESERPTFEESSSEVKLYGIQVYPNPTTGEVSIFIEEPIEDGIIIVRNLLGKEINRIKLGQYQELIRLDLQSYSGVYFISFNEGDHNVENVKVIVQ